MPSLQEHFIESNPGVNMHVVIIIIVGTIQTTEDVEEVD